MGARAWSDPLDNWRSCGRPLVDWPRGHMSSREVPGGAVPSGFQQVPLEWHEDEAVPVAVQHFDFASMDSLESHVQEALDKGERMEPILRSWLARESYELKREGLMAALSQIITSKRPDAAAWQLAFAAGLHVSLGLSGPEIAERLGITKQAFFQGVERFRRQFFGGLINLTQRSAEARQKMRARNYRHVGGRPRPPANEG